MSRNPRLKSTLFVFQEGIEGRAVDNDKKEESHLVKDTIYK